MLKLLKITAICFTFFLAEVRIIFTKFFFHQLACRRPICPFTCHIVWCSSFVLRSFRIFHLNIFNLDSKETIQSNDVLWLSQSRSIRSISKHNNYLVFDVNFTLRGYWENYYKICSLSSINHVSHCILWIDLQLSDGQSIIWRLGYLNYIFIRWTPLITIGWRWLLIAFLWETSREYKW